MRILLAAAAAAILPAATLAAPSPQISWGKAGVSLATYRAESIGCAMRAYYTGVADTNGAKNFAEASRLLDTYAGAPGDVMDNARMMGSIVHSARPDESFKDVEQFQIGLLDKCLIEHGYHRFRLTDDQRKHMEKLKIGSDARHAYLHRLATNPDILSAQGVPDPVSSPTP